MQWMHSLVSESVRNSKPYTDADMVNFGKQVKWRVTGKGYCGDILEWQEKLGTVLDRNHLVQSLSRPKQEEAFVKGLVEALTPEYFKYWVRQDCFSPTEGDKVRTVQGLQIVMR